MNNYEKNYIAELDKVISKLEEIKNFVLFNVPLIEKVTENSWVILNDTNAYFIFKGLKVADNKVKLVRNNETFSYTFHEFNNNFRLATRAEVEQHLTFLSGKNKVKENKLPEFYLITIEGKNGAVVRHPDFKTAVKEATRLAEKCNHRAHIMGVVAIVEPIVVQQPITEYQLIK